ncbi:hypothetical protein [Pseudorhodoplanes sinuspersici]|uniref:Uncharacterized protein n=1 Tax=Pseudorhodoplanes sinuspersici TaxID=1235591 RepID=A0A1W6ZWZ5_9HYPH|nr:hypothetical protein [Pseudorhodoplanes sinuspersici]ARQ01904.1 hypothetical protein CAK95_24500 [Pseudorhodoplanes sinuspersici]RKE73671.1 hypothetical protein DFP91_1566 [Pseudorhodoplanes sinuspersici]
MAQVILFQAPRPATPAALGLLKSILEPRDFNRVCELAKEWRCNELEAARAIVGAYVDAECDA